MEATTPATTATATVTGTTACMATGIMASPDTATGVTATMATKDTEDMVGDTEDMVADTAAEDPQDMGETASSAMPTAMVVTLPLLTTPMEEDLT